jgi:hypothetical protein
MKSRIPEDKYSSDGAVLGKAMHRFRTQKDLPGLLGWSFCGAKNTTSLKSGLVYCFL